MQNVRVVNPARLHKEMSQMDRRNWLGVFSLACLSLSAVGCSADIGDEDVAQVSDEISKNQIVTGVVVRFRTGGDDKRSGSQVDYQLKIKDTVHTFETNRDGWPNDSWSTTFFGDLPVNTKYSDIKDFGVKLISHNGFIQTNDNWNLDIVQIQVVLPNGSLSKVGSPGGNPLKRFTGSSPQWWWGRWPAGT
jgi:hypothetical protein